MSTRLADPDGTAYPHVLQVIMALTSVALESRECTLHYVRKRKQRCVAGVFLILRLALHFNRRYYEVKDRWIDAMGCIGLVYPNFVIFIILGPRGILVF
jgi:hypothetical protein